ncbi:Plasmid stabilization system protein ParE [Paenibacillus sp. UNCCL117]|uniref:type II toxin-antitoxin system RelE/ParE family toxin n=1 Tax=unclassified Paenibacillus TaxID=185978 RepID=UPI00088D1BD6|nr:MULTISPECIES: type II toxin-antitoxin system RelE/ParE family toxin [unclassified Paenibacillus]SDE41795.1 Plasmid stabilization system protein ParE [Paenibacillus sp. cl123]SFW65548.1 Plasmid stabilization system protein ParE [Paenibacillus sp. UNCCL117]
MVKTPQYKVIVSDRARQMLASHVRFLAEKSPEAARNTKNELLQAIRSLALMPGRYPFLDEEFIPPNKYHKMFVEKWYLILYQIQDEMVYVDHIVDCRQDYRWFVR